MDRHKIKIIQSIIDKNLENIERFRQKAEFYSSEEGEEWYKGFAHIFDSAAECLEYRHDKKKELKKLSKKFSSLFNRDVDEKEIEGEEYVGRANEVLGFQERIQKISLSLNSGVVNPFESLIYEDLPSEDLARLRGLKESDIVSLLELLKLRDENRLQQIGIWGLCDKFKKENATKVKFSQRKTYLFCTEDEADVVAQEIISAKDFDEPKTLDHFKLNIRLKHG